MSDPTFEGSDALRAALLAEVQAEPAPDRARTRALRIALTLIALAAMGGVLAIAGVHLGERPTSLVVGTLVGAVALAAIALWLALGLGRSMLGRPLRLLLLATLAIPVLLFVWKTTYTALFPDFTGWVDERPGFRCLGWSLAMGLLPMTLLLVWRRRSVERHPATLGAALGMAAGTSTWALLDLYCPIGHAAHLLLGHVLPLVLMAGLGALLGRTLFRGSARPRS